MPRIRKPPSPLVSSPPSRDALHADDETEREDVERRRAWLSKLPQTYASKHRERCVFLDVDNTTASLLKSRALFRSVAGAHCPHDVRLSFEALTDHLCGACSSAVISYQLATYSKMNPHIAQSLEKFGWTLQDEKMLQTQLLAQLQRGAATANGKTLVLAMGGGALGTGKTSAYQEILSKFLVEGWHVEIHAWLRSLNDGYLRLQSENPGRVVVKPLDDVLHDIVFLKKRKKKAKGAHAKHVCSILNSDQAPEKVDASSASDTASTVSVCNTRSPDGSPRAVSVSPIQTRVHSVPPATSPNASWIKAAMQPRAASPVSDTSSIGSASPIKESVKTASFVVDPIPTLALQPAAPTAIASVNATFVPPLPPLPPLPPPSCSTPSLFTPPLPPMPPQPTYHWMLWELQLQKMRDVLSAQQNDLAMRQCALQQTTELMRQMQDQERKTWQSASFIQQPPNAVPTPWSGVWGF